MIQQNSVGLRILFGLANLFQSHVLSDSSLLNIGKCRTSEGSQSINWTIFSEAWRSHPVPRQVPGRASDWGDLRQRPGQRREERQRRRLGHVQTCVTRTTKWNILLSLKNRIIRNVESWFLTSVRQMWRRNTCLTHNFVLRINHLRLQTLE